MLGKDVGLVGCWPVGSVRCVCQDSSVAGLSTQRIAGIDKDMVY
jgi:hypothetical protein